MRANSNVFSPLAVIWRLASGGFLERAEGTSSTHFPRLEPLNCVRTDLLNVAYYEAGPDDGEVVLLLHRWPYVWTKNSPMWNFTEADLDRASTISINIDYVVGVLHCYRQRLLYAPRDPAYADLESQLLKQPPITVPAVTLDGLADGNFPATNGSSSASNFTGPRVHHQIPGAAYNLPQKHPKAFVDAVLEVASLY